MSKCRSGFGESSLCKCILCKADRIAILERELAEVRKNHQWEMGSRAVCLTEIDKLKRELAAVSAERDALLGELADVRALLADVTATRDSYREDCKLWREKFRALYEKTGGTSIAGLDGCRIDPATPPTGTPGDGTR